MQRGEAASRKEIQAMEVGEEIIGIISSISIIRITRDEASRV
jgi:hypothetical protein